MKINLDSNRTTIRLSPSAKTKALKFADARGLSISQLVEQLINECEHSESDKIRRIVRDELKRDHK
jgi:hypothetical protein